MKRQLFFGILFCLSVVSWSQGRGQLERIKAFKTGYLTQELDLSSAEAEKFWPIYNEYEKKMFELRVEKRKAENPDGPKAKYIPKFPMIDITGKAAIVKIELRIEGKHKYTDYLSLYKFNEGWKIVNKIYCDHDRM